ncbi:hypothetical protein SAMN04488128_11037 [Chitinophaga eiseniae]|uniref:Uncharacterized protein n=1 Tax=Chitinophaga eiseniae TaxID=634771 RepID=A0A1T4U618_9BACT|nr:hypothetical protein SAMN04488128_11037 [Chitinophaga eiseniae]
MKKRKLTIPKLFLHKAVISDLSQQKITGGATLPWETCGQTICQASCQCTQFNCPSRDPNGVTCVLTCITTVC